MAAHFDAERTKTLETSDGTTYAYLQYAPQSAAQPTLLLLHGYPSTAYDWRHLIPLLLETGVGIIAPDLLGYGGTDKPTDPARYTLKRIARQVADILDAEGLQTVIGVAHDWGCGLLSRFALHYRERFSALSFMSVAYLPPSPFDIDAINAKTKEALGWEIFGYWHVFKRDDAATLIESKHDLYEALTYCATKEEMIENMAREGALDAYLRGSTPCKIGDWLSREELEIHSKILLDGGYAGPTCWYKQSVRGLGDADDEAIPQDQWKLTVPTQFIATTEDGICVPEIMLEFSKPWVEDLRVATIETGHWLFLEKPKETAEKLIAFIKDVSPGMV